MSLEELIYANLLDSANRVATIAEPTLTGRGDSTWRRPPEEAAEFVPAQRRIVGGGGGTENRDFSSNCSRAGPRQRNKPHGGTEATAVVAGRGKPPPAGKDRNSQTRHPSNEKPTRKWRQPASGHDSPSRKRPRNIGDQTSSNYPSSSRTNQPSASTTTATGVVTNTSNNLGLPAFQLDRFFFDPTTTMNGGGVVDDDRQRQNETITTTTTTTTAPASKRRRQTIRRWKDRRVDLRTVPDIGNAFATRIRILHQLGMISSSSASSNNNNNGLPDDVADEDEDHDDHSSNSDEGDDPASRSSIRRPETVNDTKAEPEDLDVMAALMKAGPKTVAKGPTKDENFWELGYTGPRGYSTASSAFVSPSSNNKSMLSHIDLSSVQASAVSSSKSSDLEEQDAATNNDSIDREILSLRRDPRRYCADRGYIPTTLSFPFYYSHHDPGFDSPRAYVGNPNHVLRVMAIRYAGNNSSTSKSEQVRTVSLLWKLHNTPRKWLSPHQKEWDFRRLRYIEARKLGEYVYGLIQNRPNEEESIGGHPLKQGFDYYWSAPSLLCKSQPHTKFAPATDPIEHGPYVFLPGTCPPMPIRPLDRLGLTWGEIDRYNTVSHETKYPDYVYVLSHSILIADRNPVKQQRFFRQCQQLVQYEMRRIMGRHQHQVEVPNAALANVIRHTLAIWPKNGVVPGDAHADGIDNNNNSNHHANCLEWLKPICDSKALLMMRDLQLTCALMDIAAHFANNDAVIEILSRHPATCNPIAMFREIVEGHEVTTNAAALEYCIHSHTNRAHLERNPTDPIEYAWYVSFLATSLVLCQGNTSFLATRIALAQALQLLYQLHKLSPSEQSRKTLQALGDWEKVWRLLLTGSSNSDGRLRPVLKYDVHGEAFEVAARALETNPSSIHAWRKVVQVLGPISRSVDASGRNDSWDLRGRDWWYDTFLKPMDWVALDAPFLQHRSLPFIYENKQFDLCVKSRKRKRIVHNLETETKWMGYLIRHLQEQKTDAAEFVEESIDDDDLALGMDMGDDLHPLPVFVNENLEVECLAYKVFLLAHFQPIDHADVGTTLLLMLAKAWEDDAICEGGVNSLRWLQMMGIDVCEVYHLAAQRQNNETAKIKSRRSRRRTTRTKWPGQDVI